MGLCDYKAHVEGDANVPGSIMEKPDDGLDLEDKHYTRRKSDLDNRLYIAYDYIEEYEKLLQSVREKKTAIEAEKITGQNIYQILICFDKLYEAIKGAESAGAEAEKFDLFKLEKYTGCISCFGCKRGKNKGHCIYRHLGIIVLSRIRIYGILSIKWRT